MLKATTNNWKSYQYSVTVFNLYWLNCSNTDNMTISWSYNVNKLFIIYSSSDGLSFLHSPLQAQVSGRQALSLSASTIVFQTAVLLSAAAFLPDRLVHICGAGYTRPQWDKLVILDAPAPQGKIRQQRSWLICFAPKVPRYKSSSHDV